MEIGALIFATDYCIRMDELARALEERGFESLFLPEHTHIPASRRTPRPGGGELPKEYWHTLDPFVALSFAAAATSKFRDNTVRLQIHALAYNLANFMRTLALPKEVEHWSLTTLRA